MAAHFDLDFVTFRCKHPKCREVFEKSLTDLVGVDDVICPRCGSAAHVSAEYHLAAAARAHEDKAYREESATR